MEHRGAGGFAQAAQMNAISFVLQLSLIAGADC